MAENQLIVGAIVGALRFRNASPVMLSSLSDTQWQELLIYADLSHLTLPLALHCKSYLPQWLRDRVEENVRDNRLRAEFIKKSYREVQLAFASSSTQHVVIKGFAQCPDYAAGLPYRFQSDIDLYCPDACLNRAVDSLRQIGYAPMATSEKSDHGPVMSRPRDWTWRGNPYDPEMPLCIEIHDRFWNHRRMRFGPSDLGDFWSRRVTRTLDDMCFPALHPVDNLGFSALQVLRDLLNGALFAHKVYELAHFLHKKATDDAFWRQWSCIHDEDFRSYQAISFCLAEVCFGCDLAPCVKDHVAKLQGTVQAWIRTYGQRSLTTHRSVEKDSVWVHMALLNSVRDKLAILMRMFLRTPDPQRVSAASGTISGVRLPSWARYGLYCLTRIPPHTMSLSRTLYRGGKTSLASRRGMRAVIKDSNDATALDFERSG